MIQDDFFAPTELLMIPQVAPKEEQLAFAKTEYPIIGLPCTFCDNPVRCKIPYGKEHHKNWTFYCSPCQNNLAKNPPLPDSYQMLHELGRGGMGVVYLVLHKKTQQKYALKMILPKGALSDEMRQILLREASLQSKLQHPRIVQVHALEELKPGILGIVMEYIEGNHAGASLQNENKNGLAEEIAINILLQTLEGLQYIHEQGVVHRDIKDPNILLKNDIKNVLVKISDFGLAHSYLQAEANGPIQSGFISGTIPYMPPEQIKGSNTFSPKLDLYAAGVTLYRLLSGKYPHEFPENRSRILVVAQDQIIPIQKRKPLVSNALASFLSRALDKNPSNRFQSAKEMCAALSSL